MPTTGPADDAAFDAAHAALLADGRVQTVLSNVKQPVPPEWLKQLIEMLQHAGPMVKFIFWAGVVVIALLVVFALYRIIQSYWPGGKERTTAPAWRPDEAPAQALLREADELASRGMFADAAHLLLLRSVDQIAERRPAAVRPALTARDIARLPVLPRDIGAAFGLIADVVEISLFGRRDVVAGDWERCRDAYAGVALPASWAA